MQYVLGLLFGFKFFKDKANLKIYIDDILIDDVDINSDIVYKNIEKYTIDYGNNDKIESIAPFTTENLSVPKKLFSYTINESAIKNHLKLVVQNNNTNYTNGFMTEYSYFQWYSIFLIPLHFLSKKEYGKTRKLIRRFKKLMNIKWIGDDPTEQPRKNFRWPTVGQKVVNRELDQDNSIYFGGEKMGGSYTLEFGIMEHKNIPKFKMLVPKDWTKIHSIDQRSINVSDYFPFIADNFKILNMHNEDK